MIFKSLLRFLRRSFRKFRKIPGNSGGVFNANIILQSENLYFYYCKIKENQGNFPVNFCESSQIPKMHKKFPRKFPGNFPENSQKTPGVF